MMLSFGLLKENCWIFRIIGMGFLLFYSVQSVGQNNERDQKLTEKLEALVDDFEGVAGVYTMNLKTQKEAGVHEDTIFPTASIVKVPILIGIFKKIEEGELNYHQPLIYRDTMAFEGSGLMQYFKDSTEIDLSTAINLMMAHSDNSASVWCEYLAGGGATVNSFLEKNGFAHTRINSRTEGRREAWNKYGWGQTTPREMAHLLMAIRNSELLPRASSERMYRDMTKAYWDEYALTEIPPCIQTASKQGMVDASRSEVVLVNAPHGDYVFYVATKKNRDRRWSLDNEAWEFARKVSKLLWTYYEPKSDWESPEKDAL